MGSKTDTYLGIRHDDILQDGGRVSWVKCWVFDAKKADGVVFHDLLQAVQIASRIEFVAESEVCLVGFA